jgi:hypothetical protein
MVRDTRSSCYFLCEKAPAAIRGRRLEYLFQWSHNKKLSLAAQPPVTNLRSNPERAATPHRVSARPFHQPEEPALSAVEEVIPLACRGRTHGTPQAEPAKASLTNSQGIKG